MRDISPPPSPTLLGSVHPHSDDEDQPRRRRIPNSSAPVASGSSNTVAASSFFNDTNPGQEAAGSVLRQALRLSPVRSPTIIESDDDDEWEVENRPIKPIPSRARPSTSSVDQSLSGKGKGVESPKADSDYGDDYYDDLPSSILENMDQLVGVEGGMSSMSTASSAGPAQNSSVAESATRSATYSVVRSPIIIEDNEEDDKENVAVPTRHVRQRTAGRAIVVDEDVMELTDSE